MSLVVLKEGKHFQLTEPSYTDLVRIADQVYQMPEFGRIVGHQFLLDQVSKWCVLRFRQETGQNLSRYLQEQSENSIRDYELWIPVPTMLTEGDFVLGKTQFTTLKETQITLWRELTKPKEETADQERRRIELFQRIAQEYQGRLVAHFHITSEAQRALEIGYEDLSDSLSVLRLFSPANLAVGLISGAYEYGSHLYESQESILYSPPPKATFSYRTGIHGSFGYGTVSVELIGKLHDATYGSFHELLVRHERNAFQEKLLDAIRIYSRHTLRESAYDKLLYVLTALESVLLKNETEPIQQNLADRIAFALAQDIETRRAIVKIVKDTYGIRSRYVHHGAIDVESNAKINEFLGVAWAMFRSLIKNLDSFATKEQCVEAIENIKYS